MRRTDAHAREALFMAVASGKGGTGKSFLATNLSVLLARRGASVTLVDGDFGLANDHLLLGVTPKLTAQHMFAKQATIRDVSLRTPFGPSLVPGGSGLSRLGSLDERDLLHFAENLEELSRDEDVVLFDAAAGISPQAVSVLVVAQHVLVVTNPEIAALTDAYALIKCLARRRPRPRVGVVVNRVRVPGQGLTAFRKLEEVSLRFAGYVIHYLGEVPEEPEVTQLRLTQAPITISRPECAATQAIQKVLNILETQIGPLQRRTSPRLSVQRRFEDCLRHGGASFS